MWFKNLSLRAKVLIGGLTPLILLLFIGIMSMTSINSIVKTNKWVVHTHEVIKQVMGIIGSAVDMETGMRGYLLAGKDSFLDPYKNGEKASYEKISILQEIVSDNPKQVNRLGEVKKILKDWQKDVTEPAIELRRQIGETKTMNDMAKLVGEARGKKYFDKFRDQIHLFIQRESNLMEKRTKEVINAETAVEKDLNKISETNKRVIHSFDILDHAKNILLSFTNMETEIRGFLLTGANNFLEPYNKSKDLFFEDINEVKEHSSDNPPQLKRIKKIEQLINRWVANFAEPAILIRKSVNAGSKTQADINAYVSRKTSNKDIDEFHKNVEEFIKIEEDLVVKRKKESENAFLEISSNFMHIKKSRNWVEHTHKVIASANSIQASAVDMETGMRGYLLAGKENFLEPYNKGYKYFFDTSSKLKKTVNDNPEQVKLLENIENTVKDWENKVTEPSIALRREIGDAKTMDDMADLVGEAREKKYFDKFREITNEFISDEKSLMNIRNEANTQTVSRTDITIIISLIASILIGLILSLLITKSVLNQLGCDPSMLATAAKKIAQGDMSQRLSNSENESVAKCMDQMSDVLEKVIAEFDLIVKEIESGKLNNRGDTTVFQGSYSDLIKGGNKLIDVLVGYIDSIPVPTMVVDKSFNINYMSKQGADLMGKSAKDLVGMKCYDCFKTSDCQTAKCACSQAMNTGNIANSQTDAHPGGKNLEIDYYGVPIVDSKGEIAGAFEIIIDQTEIIRNQRIAEKVATYQDNEVESLSTMLRNVADGDMTQVYNPVKSDADTSIIYDSFSNIGSALNATVAKIGEANKYQEKVNQYQENEVKQLSQILIKVSDGDMTQKYEIAPADSDTAKVSNNFKEIANALNDTILNLSNILSQVKNNSQIIANSSEELSAVSIQLTQRSEDMTDKSNNAASATEEMTYNINTIAASSEEMSVNAANVSSSAEELSTNMNTVASAVEQMTASMNVIANNAKDGSKVAIQAKDMSNEATVSMNTLGEAAREIGKVTDVIKRIAEQTNLLALNATIEAASAGDAGKGFAVVANEIKELANQSAQAAEDIAKRIDGVQSNTEDAVNVIKQVAETITNINESVKGITISVEEQTQSTNEIAQNIAEANSGVTNIAISISEVAKGTTEMSSNTSEAAKGANEVSTNISGVNQAAVETNEISQQIKTSAGELSSIAQQLQENVNKFKVSD
ncbi:methyl-accepting chemotaxis protein [Candidatus Magnetomorum sp. HK-1]|nr:methyl-accepting chemotaxis protein [Candidatus Magnetomorum sp. HK-1]